MPEATGTIDYKDLAIIIGLVFFMLERVIKILTPLIKKPKEDNKPQIVQQVADPAIIKAVEGIFGLLKLNGKAVDEIKANQKEYIKVSYETRNEVLKINDTVQKDHNKFGKLVSDVGMISSETSADAHRNDGNFKTLIGKVEGVQKEISDFRLQVAEGKAKLA